MQLRLPSVDPERQISPAAERQSPAFWVRRVVVVRELAPGAPSLVREVELRRGLNIISTPPQRAQGPNALFQNGIASHTAGKSTLCRLIRYVLGERSFASERTRRRIREAFPDGWVLAEVVVGDAEWGVARPFGVGAHSFCVKGGTIAGLLAGGDRSEYVDFIDAISQVAVADLPAKIFPTSEESVSWEHVLPWLSRDQECRFSDVLEWRHSGSGAEAPALTVDERQFLVRSVLGLISDTERQEQLRNARLVSRKKELARRGPVLGHQVEVDRSRVRMLLGMEGHSQDLALFAVQVPAEISRQKASVVAAEGALVAGDTRPASRSELDRAIELSTNARRDLKDAELKWTVEKGALEALMSPPEAGASLLAGLPPSREYCSVPMRLAREHGCQLAVSLPRDLGTERSKRTVQQDIVAQQQLVGALAGVVAEKRSALADAERAEAHARRAAIASATEFEARRDRLVQEKARLAHIERLANEAEKAADEAQGLANEVVVVDQDIQASYDKQDASRREGKAALGAFSSTFEYVVRSLLGEEVEARAELLGRSLSLHVADRGERESAALETLKLLAFDLAALTESIQGRGSVPRFLLHDGPRDADLAEDIYERIFLFARKLEECFEGEPSFQYIITTTTQPPAELRQEPWLRATLLGSPSSERLLRCDL